ncbi:MAG: ATP-binding protein [Cyclobacteriaceae bacterium]
MKRLVFFVPFLFLSLISLAQESLGEAFIDLSKHDFENRITALEGNWEFYWEDLIEHERRQHPDTLISFPFLWNNIKLNGHALPSYGYASLKTSVILPAGSRDYTLLIEDMYCAYELFVNGESINKNGMVAKTKEAYTPQWKPEFITLHNLKDTNTFILQIANFHHHKAGSSEGIFIGNAANMKSWQTQILSFDLILTGCLIMGGLFFLGLYFFGHHDKAIFYFAMFCIVYSYRIIGFGYYALHHLINIPWNLAIRLEYITLFLSTFLFGKFIENLYPGQIYPVLWKFMYVVIWTFISITALLPPIVFTHLITPFFIFLLVYIAITLVIYYRAYQHSLIGSEYSLVSAFIVFAVFGYNIFTYFGFTEQNLLATFFGYILFFFSQSLILSFRFAHLLKQEKIRAEIASQAKSDFLSTISHEIRTPLNAVVGMSHFLLDENPRPDQKENLTSLKYSAEHLTALITDILDYNKLESGNIQFEEMNVNLSQIGQNLLQFYSAKANEKGLNFIFEGDKKIKPWLIMDATRMNQVLNNLLDNAIKFTKHGEVKMVFTVISENALTQQIRFEISDTGVGIPDDKLTSIFERFTQASSSTTREFGGSGLGLSIVKKLLELQHVSIQAKSKPGKGTTFTFDQVFKIGEETTKKVKADTSATQTEIRGGKILLVEDNNLNVVVASKFLRKWGLECSHAENGEEAVKMARLNKYSLILMDLQMPVMDGYRATEKIRAFDRKTPIIALTASALMEDQERIKQAGMDDFITKPFHPTNLREKIIKYTHQP